MLLNIFLLPLVVANTEIEKWSNWIATCQTTDAFFNLFFPLLEGQFWKVFMGHVCEPTVARRSSATSSAGATLAAPNCKRSVSRRRTSARPQLKRRRVRSRIFRLESASIKNVLRKYHRSRSDYAADLFCSVQRSKRGIYAPKYNIHLASHPINIYTIKTDRKRTSNGIAAGYSGAICSPSEYREISKDSSNISDSGRASLC